MVLVGKLEKISCESLDLLVRVNVGFVISVGLVKLVNVIEKVF